jgi:hypothetical protein
LALIVGFIFDINIIIHTVEGNENECYVTSLYLSRITMLLSRPFLNKINQTFFKNLFLKSINQDKVERQINGLERIGVTCLTHLKTKERIFI